MRTTKTITAPAVAPAATPPPSAGDRLWSITDVSRYLGVPVGTIYQWRHRSFGPRAFRVGRSLRFDPVDVRAWLDEQAA